MALVSQGGVVLWLIMLLSVFTATIILYKFVRLMASGAFSRKVAERAVMAWTEGDAMQAKSLLKDRRDMRARLVATCIDATTTHPHNETRAREEASRVAKNLLADASSLLRALELVATIAPLLGLLGTVLGMIDAFQSLQAAGTRADPSTLAGGIWEALLTTAAGMAVAIPASAALSYFEAVVERLRLDFEDVASRVFNRPAEYLIRAAE
ncbi:MAG: MotA/TolQ/ExbB proton channel family protein [Pseudomonadota bacterium]